MNNMICLTKQAIVMLLISILVILNSVFDGLDMILIGILVALELLNIGISHVTYFKKLLPYYELVHSLGILYLFGTSCTTQLTTIAYAQLMELLYQRVKQLAIKCHFKLGFYLLAVVNIIIQQSLDNPTYLYIPTVAAFINIAYSLGNQEKQKITQPDQIEFKECAKENVLVDSHPHSNERLPNSEKPEILLKSSPCFDTLNTAELLNVFPQGIALYEIQHGDGLKLEFTNSNMMKLFSPPSEQQLLQRIISLDKQQVVELQQERPLGQNQTSVTSFNSFQPAQVPINPYRSPKRAQTLNKPLLHTNSPNLFRLGSFMLAGQQNIIIDPQVDQDSDTVILSEIKSLVKLLRRSDTINYMRTQQQLIQQHDIILGYLTDEQDKQRRIEVKIYIALLNEKPQLLFVARDVTYRDYIQTLQEYSKQKSKTLSFVSHEYRTPLNCIIEMLNSVYDEQHKITTLILDQDASNPRSKSSQKQKKLIKIALDNAKYLLNLSDDLLDLAQMKVGKFKLQKKKFNFEQLINNCTDIFQVTAEKSLIRLQINYDPNAPKFIHQDQNRLRQVIINLLGNAFKFTESGSIQVKVQQLYQKRLEVSVIDTGIGISEGDQAKLFQAFGKGNSDENRKLNVQGVGLGLLISNQIVQNINSDLQSGLKFKSTQQKGSSFQFTLPIDSSIDIESLNSMEERDQDSEQSIISPSGSQHNFVHKIPIIQNQFMKRSTKAIVPVQILIVDDTRTNIEALKQLLKIIGIDFVDSSINGEGALQLCRDKWNKTKEFYKLILMDLEMPRMDGFKTTELILEMVKQHDISVAIVGCSSYDEHFQKQQCLDAGMLDYLPKPVQRQDLSNILKKYLII